MNSLSEAEVDTPHDLGIPIKTEKVVRGSIREEMNYLGNVKSKNQLFLSFKQPGFVNKLHVKEGDNFMKGDLLSELDSAEILIKKEIIQQKRFTASLNLEHLKDLLEKNRILYEAGAVTKQQIDDLTLQYHMAENSLREADIQIREIDLQLARSNIYAPYKGEVRELLKKEGEFIQPGQPVLNISEANDLVVELAVIEKDLPHINIGDEVLIRLNDGQIIESQVQEIANTLNPQTKTGNIEIPINDPNNNLLPNMSVKVTIVKNKKENSLLISDKAIVNKNSKYFVYSLENGFAVEKEVELGLRDGKRVEVVNGLSLDDEVITTNLQEINNNSRVFVYKGVE